MMRKLLIGLLALSLTACFKTREVEPPETTSSDWISPVNYEILLDNMLRAIAQQNVQNYLRCFNQDSFAFFPSTPVLTGNELIWSNWSQQDERVWFENVIADLGILSGNGLELNEVDLQTFSSDSVRYIGDYELVMNHTDTALTVNFQGQLELLMKVNGFNEWEISRWTDYETRSDSSWSRLKLTYVQ